MIYKLYKKTDTNITFNEFKSNIYLKVTRNYIRYRWAIIYLLGSTGVMHESFKCGCMTNKNEIADSAYSCNNVISFRNGECGYNNKVTLYPNYNSIEEYVASIKEFVKEGLIQSHKELYSSVRLKAKDSDNLLDSLINEGILYLEYRSIDINPFDKCGISLDDLYFVQLFNLFLLFKDEDDYDRWQEEAYENHMTISKNGQLNVELSFNGNKIKREEWLLNILDDISSINDIFNIGMNDIINKMKHRALDVKETYTYRMIELVKKEGYVNANLQLAKKYKEEAYNNRFKLIGYEDMELSTQILMKEAIKRGIKVDVVDRSDNFISLEKYGKIEYVKQATKTSKDNYSTVLIMENKVVTKKVLDKAGIKIPRGIEFYSEEEAINKINDFKNKPIVIKPKSTNFGIGISIFKDGGSEEDILKALNIAFKYDNTVVVEEFIEGKEYRFLVIADKVIGVLHRVPANVVGDGVNSIEELVHEKNLNPLRGKGYKTPLEKIILDDNAILFLKQSNKDINYIPKKDEVVYLRENSNISTGGDSIDYTDDMPEIFKDVAVSSAKAVGANICGVDMMIADYKNVNSDYGIIELNFNPAIHIHSYPFVGKERNIAVEILKLLDLN